MLLAIDLDEDFINVNGISIATVLPLQASGIDGSEFDTPQADRFATDSDASFG